MTVYAAEESAIANTAEESETVKETTTSEEVVTINDISWKIDAEKSSFSEFSSDAAGSVFVYEPHLPEEYEIGMDLPTITVEIRELVAFSHIETVDGYTISLNAAEGIFPEGTTVKIKKVSESRR